MSPASALGYHHATRRQNLSLDLSSTISLSNNFHASNRSSEGYFSREPSAGGRSFGAGGGSNNSTPAQARRRRPSQLSMRTANNSGTATPRLSGGGATSSSAVTPGPGGDSRPFACNCPGCPGNPLVHLSTTSSLLNNNNNYNNDNNNNSDREDDVDSNEDIINENLVGPGGEGCGVDDPEDYLDTLDRKVTEIMHRDSSRRSSSHADPMMGAGGGGKRYNSVMMDDLYGPMGGYCRPAGPNSHLQLYLDRTDLNCNLPGGGGGGGRLYRTPSAQAGIDGLIRFEEDGKDSSSEAMESSQEDLTQAWSEEESDQYSLRRRR